MIPCVFICCGGTAGHVFPAVALAKKLTSQNFIVHLLTDHRAKAYAQNIDLWEFHHTLSSASLSLSYPHKMLNGLFQLGKGYWESHRLLNTFHPRLVIGFGGYPTVPPLLAAVRAKIPTLIHDQNSIFGRANRFLAPYVTAIASSFQDTHGCQSFEHKITCTGNPVRENVLKASHTPYSLPLPGEPFRFLVFGGSQGAHFLSTFIPGVLTKLKAISNRTLLVTHQTRVEDQPYVASIYKSHGIVAEVKSFFSDLPERMAQSHCVISRSGASTIAELCVIGRPSILFPFPHSLDQDQQRNADILAKEQAALVFREQEITAKLLVKQLEAMLNSPDLLITLAANAKKLGRSDAITQLSQLAQQLYTKKSL